MAPSSKLPGTSQRKLTADLTEKTHARRDSAAARNAADQFRPTPARNDLLPALAIKYTPIADLKSMNRKVRRATAPHVAEVRNSIETFGMVLPIICTADGRVVDGEIRLQAAKEAGLKNVPTITVGHLSEGKLRALRLTCNRLQEKGQWDIEELNVELQELIVLEEDVLVTGFDAAEIDIILSDNEDELSAASAESLPAIGQKAVSRLGDCWLIGPHILYQGDACQPSSYDSLFGDGAQARVILTDEPYNVPNYGHVTGNKKHREFSMANGEMTREQFLAFNVAWMMASTARLLDGGLLATFIDWRSVDIALQSAKETGLDLINLIVWTKTNAGMGSLWRSQHELLPVFKKGSAPHVNNVALGRYGRWRSNVWSYPGASSLGSDARAGLADHPTVKPVAMLADALIDVTNRGEIVLDPFAGSGSTLIAAEETGRVCRAIEIDGLYCDLIIRRWEALTGQTAVLAGTDEPFASVSRQRGEG